MQKTYKYPELPNIVKAIESFSGEDFTCAERLLDKVLVFYIYMTIDQNNRLLNKMNVSHYNTLGSFIDAVSISARNKIENVQINELRFEMEYHTDTHVLVLIGLKSGYREQVISELFDIGN